MTKRKGSTQKRYKGNLALYNEKEVDTIFPMTDK